jgi:opacity protein-like surface antigen
VPYGRFEPYGFLGLGVYFVDDEISVPGLGTDSDSDANLGYHIGLGGNYTLSNNIFLGVEARYLFLETDTFGVNFKLDGVTLTGNVGYRF